MADQSQVSARTGLRRNFRDNSDGSFAEEFGVQLRAWDPTSLSWVKVIVDHASGALSTTGGGGGGGGAVTVADGADVAQGTTTDLSSANTVVGILKAIKAAITGTLTVGGTVTATGPLTDTQLRATRVPVDASGVAVPITDNSGTITVDAPVGTPVWVRESDGAAAFVGQKTMAASKPVVIASDQSAIAVNDPGLPDTLGQKTMAGSTGVVLASDQASIPVAATLAAETTKVIGTVNAPALTKGTQGANGWSVQDLKDSGRVNIMWTAEFTHAQVAETLLTITESRDGAAVTTFSSKAVTNGKRLRITSIAMEVESLGTGTTPQRAYLRMRFNTGGAATTSSPLQGVWGLGVTSAIVKASEKEAWQFPDGIEFLGDGTKQIGFSLETPDWVVTTATGRTKITITGFEY